MAHTTAEPDGATMVACAGGSDDPLVELTQPVTAIGNISRNNAFHMAIHLDDEWVPVRDILSRPVDPQGA